MHECDDINVDTQYERMQERVHAQVMDTEKFYLEIKDCSDFSMWDTPDFNTSQNNTPPPLYDTLSWMQDVFIAHKVIDSGLPNFLGCRIPLRTNWNIILLKSLLVNYYDIEVTELLKYGFPISYREGAPDPIPNNVNHKGATCFPEVIDQYVLDEIAWGATFGPFVIPPFIKRIGISPLSTREKRESGKRRVIMDLSFPEGFSVNSYIDKDFYLGEPIKLTYPSVDILARRIAQLGANCLLYKRDLARFFRQIPACPRDYSLLGWRWNNMILFDKNMPMGLRSAAYIAQRITNSLVFIHHEMGYFSINYLDDFGSAETQEMAWPSFNALSNIFSQVGVQEAIQKAVFPTTRMSFLGTLLDTVKMTIEVEPQRKTEIEHELDKWQTRNLFTRQELESLIGKLQFISNCVRGSRVFIARMLNTLRGSSRNGLIPVDIEMRKDINWWRRFIAQYNGVSILWLVQYTQADEFISSDACLQAAGAVCDGEYYHAKFPYHIAGMNIAYLEFLAIIVALKKWKHKLNGKSCLLNCDNQAVVYCINSGLAKDQKLTACLREMAWLTCQNDCLIKAQYISTTENLIPDLLSRWYNGGRARRQFKKLNSKLRLKRRTVSEDLFNISNVW